MMKATTFVFYGWKEVMVKYDTIMGEIKYKRNTSHGQAMILNAQAVLT